MTTEMPITVAQGPHGTSQGLDVTAEELELIRTALRLLLSTLGRDQADELDEVRTLLAKLPAKP